MLVDISLGIVKMSVVPNLIQGLHAIPVKIPASYSVDINTVILTGTWRSQRP